MRWEWIVIAIIIAFFSMRVFGVTPQVQSYKTEADIAAEIKNVTDNCQDRQFTFYPSTPLLSDLRDGEIVGISSGAFNALILRSGQDIFKINTSCITVFR